MKAEFFGLLLIMTVLVIAMLPTVRVALADSFPVFNSIAQRKCIPVNRDAFLFLRKGGGS